MLHGTESQEETMINPSFFFVGFNFSLNFVFFFQFSGFFFQENCLLLLHIYINFFFSFLCVSAGDYHLQMATKVGPDGRTHYVYTISGVRVEFPAKAYPTQIAMMDKVSNNGWNDGTPHASQFFCCFFFVVLFFVCVCLLEAVLYLFI